MPSSSEITPTRYITSLSGIIDKARLSTCQLFADEAPKVPATAAWYAQLNRQIQSILMLAEINEKPVSIEDVSSWIAEKLGLPTLNGFTLDQLSQAQMYAMT